MAWRSSSMPSTFGHPASAGTDAGGTLRHRIRSMSRPLSSKPFAGGPRLERPPLPPGALFRIIACSSRAASPNSAGKPRSSAGPLPYGRAQPHRSAPHSADRTARGPSTIAYQPRGSMIVCEDRQGINVAASSSRIAASKLAAVAIAVQPIRGGALPVAFSDFVVPSHVIIPCICPEFAVPPCHMVAMHFDQSLPKVFQVFSALRKVGLANLCGNSAYFRNVPCVDGSLLARVLLNVCARLVGAAMCSTCYCGAHDRWP